LPGTPCESPKISTNRATSPICGPIPSIFPIGHHRRPQLCRTNVRQKLPQSPTPAIHHQKQRRAGSPRSHPTRRQ
jgi:hypothetical protein